MAEIQNSKSAVMMAQILASSPWVIGYWDLRFICYLMLEIWDFVIIRHEFLP